jgi:hypothetical protein
MSSATVFGVGSSNDPEIMLADVVRHLAAIEDLVWPIQAVKDNLGPI